MLRFYFKQLANLVRLIKREVSRVIELLTAGWLRYMQMPCKVCLRDLSLFHPAFDFVGVYHFITPLLRFATIY